MPESYPEAKARKNIDAQLNASACAVLNLDELNLTAKHGVTVRGLRSKGGPAGYVLIVDVKAFGISLPPLAELNRIVAEVEVRTTSIDHFEAELDRQITHSNRLGNPLLPRHSTGDFKT